MNRTMWTLRQNQALTFIRSLYPVLHEAGFSIGLTGSVLREGFSGHDLDLIIYPLQRLASTDFEKAREALKSMGGVLRVKAEAVRARWRKKGSVDEKTVEVWYFGVKRVDVFFLA